jgi:hypothetical protein
MNNDSADNNITNVTETSPPETPASALAPTQFDFAEHEQAAISAYLAEQPFYADLAAVIARVIDECLRKRRIKV